MIGAAGLFTGWRTMEPVEPFRTPKRQADTINDRNDGWCRDAPFRNLEAMLETLMCLILRDFCFGNFGRMKHLNGNCLGLTDRREGEGAG
ncbi:hypothetical protein HJA88_11195 [Rhizobium bangladeshense]|nr:hypothetical protein [Rhizobium bangladeshense]